jgi:hypothetical protein
MPVSATKVNVARAQVKAAIDNLNLTAEQKTGLSKAIGEAERAISKEAAKNNPVDWTQDKLIDIADQALGKIGASLVGLGMMGAGVAGGINAGKEVVKQLGEAAGEFKKADDFLKGAWNSIPDIGAAGAYGAFVLASAYFAFRAGANWAEHVGLIKE